MGIVLVISLWGDSSGHASSKQLGDDFLPVSGSAKVPVPQGKGNRRKAMSLLIGQGSGDIIDVLLRQQTEHVKKPSKGVSHENERETKRRVSAHKNDALSVLEQQLKENKDQKTRKPVNAPHLTLQISVEGSQSSEVLFVKKLNEVRNNKRRQNKTPHPTPREDSVVLSASKGKGAQYLTVSPRGSDILSQRPHSPLPQLDGRRKFNFNHSALQVLAGPPQDSSVKVAVK